MAKAKKTPAKAKAKPKAKAKAKPKVAAKVAKAAAAKPKAKPKATSRAAPKAKPASKAIDTVAVLEALDVLPPPAEPAGAESEPFEFSDDDLDGLSFTIVDEKPDAAAFAPGTLVAHDGGRYSLIYSKFPASDELQKVYAEHGVEGGGYTWHGFVVHLMKQHAPQALDAIEFDPEGSMFCAVSSDLAALRAVGAALAQLEDIELVKRLAATVDVSAYD